MINKKIGYLGASAVAVLTIAASSAAYVTSGAAVSTPSHAASLTEGHSDPAPQRFELAQAQTSGQAGGAAASTLPGGASSLNETYKDWRVTCVQQGATKRCALSQTQVQQNGQRVLAIELAAPSGNTVTGTLVLPFGLALDSGIAFQIDEKAYRAIPAWPLTEWHAKGWLDLVALQLASMRNFQTLLDLNAQRANERKALA